MRRFKEPQIAPPAHWRKGVPPL